MRRRRIDVTSRWVKRAERQRGEQAAQQEWQLVDPPEVHEIRRFARGRDLDRAGAIVDVSLDSCDDGVADRVRTGPGRASVSGAADRGLFP